MAYIGNIPADKYQTLQKQSFSTSATDTYTLSYAVTNPQDLALFINNVRQNPNDAYTVSGTTLHYPLQLLVQILCMQCS